MSTKLSKSALAKSLGVSRRSLYYQPKRIHRDEILRDRILHVFDENPAYGYRNIALHLKINKKRIQRVMQKYSLRPRILPKNRYRGKKAESVIGEIPNRIKVICPTQPDVVWAGDFTHLRFHGRDIYLATIIDLFSREIVAWQIGIHHTTGLVVDVLKEAQRKRKKVPWIFHSDQGSEYTSLQCLGWLTKANVLPSWSPKGKPWNNGAQESFYRTFKLEFGKPRNYVSLEKLIEAIGKYMNYYNTRRIHSRLKMSPRQYAEIKTWKE